jgi:hypothetical protein
LIRGPAEQAHQRFGISTHPSNLAFQSSLAPSNALAKLQRSQIRVPE